MRQPDYCYPVDPPKQGDLPRIVTVVNGTAYTHVITKKQLKRWLVTLTKGVDGDE